MLLTAIAVILGSILGTYIIRTYLNEYTYMNLNYILPVAIAISATFVIAFASVLWQTLRAARTNPAEALKKE
jgi:ABC-type antimicrobial peptide transport system permease subunit